MAKNILPTYNPGLTRVHAHQFNLRTLFPVKLILKSRGYEVKKEGEFTDLLINAPLRLGDAAYEMLLQCFNENGARNQLRSFVMEGKQPTDPKAVEVVNHPNFEKKHALFTKTFEWYIGEAMVRFFEGFSFSYGVDIPHVKLDETDPGDFDTLVVMRNLGLLYFECKTGKFDRIKIKKAVDRAVSLNCESVIIFAFSLVEEDLKYIISRTAHPLLDNLQTLSKIQIKDSPESTVYEWHNCYFLSADKDFIEQMKTVLRVNEAKRVFFQYAYRPDNNEFSKMGYIAETLIQVDPIDDLDI